ncbi:type VI secretion system lipoprotein TssJ [Catenovulum sp. SM1970]|uniref:type VI secretion system lipoprotein TssJ n=1 Tax=Marinifaba aquimaris TaxID=2741323 RepID=UPI00157386B4|nr:type VI secretion system lipoprotein TssJ [Marinifaba aquimaris]NTS77901.1 type VI secretion system lipoprotein TssJ [Marinifaba aquimaris]
MKFLKATFFFGLVCLLGACSSTKVTLDVSATDNLNLNRFDEPLPVVLRVYQLTDVQAFNNATFNDLWKSDKSVLANTLVTMEEHTVYPSDQTKIVFDQAELANYVAIFALFRDRAENNWRVFYKLDGGTVQLSTELDVALTSNSISLPKVETPQEATAQTQDQPEASAEDKTASRKTTRKVNKSKMSDVERRKYEHQQKLKAKATAEAESAANKKVTEVLNSVAK